MKLRGTSSAGVHVSSTVAALRPTSPAGRARLVIAWTCVAAFVLGTGCAQAPPPSPFPASYQRIKAELDQIPIIDTHDHLMAFDRLEGYADTDKGRGMGLEGLWRNSYFPWTGTLTPYQPGQPFAEWWAEAKDDFDDMRGTSFYRYMLPAFQDLYGIDFDRITDEQAASLNDRIFENYKDQRWLYEVVTERANIELMFTDPYWDRLGLEHPYPFTVLVHNVTTLTRGFHPTEFRTPNGDPYAVAAADGLRVESLDDYLALLDHLLTKAKAQGAVGLKSVIAYERSLEFRNVPRAAAERAFGRTRAQLSPEEIRDFQDFIMWRLVELSAKHELPFQIHTGDARVQGSNPMLLVDMIQANPDTKFILFHGGYPWVGETAVIAMRHRNVWIDSVWLATLNYTTARRAYQEWIDIVPSDRIMWGADVSHAEGIYGATEFTRRNLAEALSEKVDRGELKEDHAVRIGRQILRDNALKLFPQLEARLWKHKGPLTPPS